MFPLPSEFLQRNAKRWSGFARRWTANGNQAQVVKPQNVVIVGRDEDDTSGLDGLNLLANLGAGNAGALGFEALTDTFVVGLHLEQRTAGASQKFSIAVGPRLPGATAPLNVFQGLRGGAGSKPGSADPWEYQGADVLWGLDVFDTPDLGQELVWFPEPGILVRRGESVWVRLQITGVQANEVIFFTRKGGIS